LPAVVWMSMVCSAAGSAVWSVTLVMGIDVIGSVSYCRDREAERRARPAT
jgi:hypothetical protein